MTDTLFRTDRVEFVDAAGSTHHVTFLIYKGLLERKAAYQHIEQQVQIDAFRVQIIEVVGYGGKFEKPHEIDLGYLSSRSGDIGWLVNHLKRSKLEHLSEYVEEVIVDAQFYLDRDAYRELKKVLGLRNVKKDVTKNPVISNREHIPGKEIERELIRLRRRERYRNQKNT